MPAENNQLIDNLSLHVKLLSDIQPPRNYSNINSLEKAGNYIYDEFKKCLGSAELQVVNNDGNDYHNIIGRYGNGDEKVILGAHYDVDGITPGADDNASAIAGLIEIAKLFGSKKPKLKYQVEFVAYTLEECPYFRSNKMGSYIHAQKLKNENTAVIAMVCLEMIGYFGDEENSQKYPHPDLNKIYPTVGNFIGVIGKEGQEWLVKHMETHIKLSAEIHVQAIAAPPGLSEAIALSDHINYWKHDFDAVMINDTSFYRNPNYHRLSDTPETLNYEKMAEVVNGVYHALLKF